MYLEYVEKRVGMFFKRRDATSGRIPSLNDYDGKLRWLHDVAAYQGCPFAASTMSDCEKALEIFRECVNRAYEELVERNKGSLLQLADEEKVKLDVSNLCRMAVIYSNTICVLGEVYKEQHIAVKSGTWTLKESSRQRKMLVKRAVSAKCRPYGYVDRVITGRVARGSQEWEDSVRELKREPAQVAYEPRYFMVKRDKLVVSV